MITADFTPEELGEAHRAVLSLRNKSEKASGKLKEGSWQKTKLDSYVKAADTDLKLIDGDMAMPFEYEALNEAKILIVGKMVTLKRRWISQVID